MTNYNKLKEMRNKLEVLDSALDKNNRTYEFTKYKLFMYRFYKEFLENDIEKFNRDMKKYNSYYSIDSKPLDNLDFYTYDEFLKKNSNRYLFLSKIKNILIEHYENRLDELYKNIFHPKIIAAMLDEGYEIEDAFAKLEESVKYVSP